MLSCYLFCIESKGLYYEEILPLKSKFSKFLYKSLLLTFTSNGFYKSTLFNEGFLYPKFEFILFIL